MVDQKRIAAFNQTMVELKSVRARAERAGLSRAFHAKWERVVTACWKAGEAIEGLSPLAVYQDVVKRAV